MADLTPFATKEQLAAYWRTLTSEEGGRADILLELASNRLRLVGGDDGVDLDAKSAASPAYETTLRWVVMEAVKRAMQAPQDLPPVESSSMTAGPYSQNYKYTNPSGDLWFKKTELTALGLFGRQTISSITPNTDYYLYSS